MFSVGCFNQFIVHSHDIKQVYGIRTYISTWLLAGGKNLYWCCSATSSNCNYSQADVSLRTMTFKTSTWPSLYHLSAKNHYIFFSFFEEKCVSISKKIIVQLVPSHIVIFVSCSACSKYNFQVTVFFIITHLSAPVEPTVAHLSQAMLLQFLLLPGFVSAP